MILGLRENPNKTSQGCAAQTAEKDAAEERLGYAHPRKI
jgi:hypothetical protein